MKPALCLALLCLAVAASAEEPTEDERILEYSKACAKAASPGAINGGSNTSEAYFLSVADGRPRIDLDVDLRYWPGGMTEKEMDAAVGQMETSRQAIQKFYGNYGIRVEPVFHHQRSEREQVAGKYHFIVYLSKFMDGMRSMYWGVNANWPQRDREMIHTHEFGHLLGLKDEYETPRAVRLGEPDNIMRNWDAPNGRLYLRQIKEILAPMCPAL